MAASISGFLSLHPNRGSLDGFTTRGANVGSPMNVGLNIDSGYTVLIKGAFLSARMYLIPSQKAGGIESDHQHGLLRRRNGTNFIV